MMIEKYGRLTPLEFIERDKWGAARWRFTCDCGNENYIARLDQVKRGLIESCGCLRNERAATRCRLRIKHGHSRKGDRSTEYVSWRNMLGRCTDPNNERYPQYGGRGITVCERWLNSFPTFLADMGPKPDSSYTIGRLDNDGNYELSNCRWETPTQQNRNRSNCRFVSYDGRSMTIAEACELTGIPRNVVDGRLRNGWAPERAVTEPVKSRR